jgi:hypothetical protein
MRAGRHPAQGELNDQPTQAFELILCWLGRKQVVTDASATIRGVNGRQANVPAAEDLHDGAIRSSIMGLPEQRLIRQAILILVKQNYDVKLFRAQSSPESVATANVFHHRMP